MVRFQSAGRAQWLLDLDVSDVGCLLLVDRYFGPLWASTSQCWYPEARPHPISIEGIRFPIAKQNSVIRFVEGFYDRDFIPTSLICSIHYRFNSAEFHAHFVKSIVIKDQFEWLNCWGEKHLGSGRKPGWIFEMSKNENIYFLCFLMVIKLGACFLSD